MNTGELISACRRLRAATAAEVNWAYPCRSNHHWICDFGCLVFGNAWHAARLHLGSRHMALRYETSR
jgi:hypothetical protein